MSLRIACTRLGRRYLDTDNGCDWGHRANVGQPCPRCKGEDVPHTGRPWAERARLAIEAAERGMTMGSLNAKRDGQLGLFAAR
jgi:hypothetical protein